MFNLLVWLITVACFAVALRATYLIAFEKAWEALRDKRDNPENVPLSAPNLIVEPVNAVEAAPAGAELDAALQRNRDLVREIALLKDQLYASQTTTQSLRDRLDARTRREAELSDEESARAAQFELATMRTAYQNGEAAEQRQEALRQISEIEGEIAGLFSGPSKAAADEATKEAELAEIRRELAEGRQVSQEISNENLRLREQIGVLERRLRQHAAENQQVLKTQQSLGEIVARLQTLTDTTLELQHSLTDCADPGCALPASAPPENPSAMIDQALRGLNDGAESNPPSHTHAAK